MKRNVIVGGSILGLAAILGAGSVFMKSEKAVVHAAGVMVPKFEVDPLWPKPLPNHWVIGQTIGLSMDTHDNVWIIHRPGSLEPKESYLDKKRSRLLHGGSGCSGIRSGRKPDTSLGQGRGPRLADVESRNHGR